jgi:Spy/CpxP family protein refolding chaperone
MDRAGVGWLSAATLSLAVVTSLGLGSSGRAMGAGSALGPAGIPQGFAPAEVRGLQEGEGMGLARVAELNGYPGPAQVLEAARAGKMGLYAEQREAIERIHATTKAKAQALGHEILSREASLEAVFRAGPMVDAELARQVEGIAQKVAELRLTHLRAHVLTAAILRPEQIEEYYEFRGILGPSRGHALGF